MSGGGTESLESGVVRAGELSLHHTHGGSGAPPVLFIHGLGSSGYMEWRFTLAVLARSRRVLAPDLPGFGRSEKPRLPYGLRLFETAIYEYVRAVGGGPMDVVGTSMGGRIAIDLALTHPPLVRRLVLVNSLGLGPPRLGPFYPVVVVPRVGEAVLRGVRGALGGLPPSVIRSAAGRSVGMSVDPRRALGDGYLADLREMHAAEGYHEAYLATVRSLARPDAFAVTDLTAPLAAVGIPVLLLWGADDPLFPLETARRAHRLIPGSGLAVIKGAGHTPQAERPDEFNQVVQRFLDA
jgi:pimeloyl-ACP methyl ester carboxylesterase